MFIEFLYSNERHTYLSNMGVRDGTGQQVLREEFTVAITLGDKSVDSACQYTSHHKTELMTKFSIWELMTSRAQI